MQVVLATKVPEEMAPAQTPDVKSPPHGESTIYFRLVKYIIIKIIF